MDRELPVGVVEGFYGPPWSHSDRISIIKFLGNNDFNIYIYAPKDDPYHREKWAEPYPRDLFGRIRQLVRVAGRSGVSFCFAVSPGLSMRYSSDGDFERLASKFGEVAKLGVDWFGLFLDDIPQELQHEEDKLRFKSLGEAHAHMGNKLYESLVKMTGGKANLVVCPTQYTGVEPTDYHMAISGALSQSIYVMWTGRYVCSPTITAEDADSFGSGIGRKPFLWDNYPVNDYVHQKKVFLGPLRGRSPDLVEHLSGFVSNPMNQAEASKFALVTLREYIRDPYRYDPDRAWENAVKELLQKQVRKAFLALSEHSRASFMDYRESEKLSQLLEKVASKPKDLDALRAMSSYLISQRRAVALLSRRLTGPLRRDLMPVIRKVSNMLDIGIASTELLKRTKKGVTKTARRKAKALDTMLKRTQVDEHQVLGEMKLKFSMDGRESIDRPSHVTKLATLALDSSRG